MSEPGSPAQLIGRQVWVLDDGEGRWRVYPALVVAVREREAGYGPYQGTATLVWVRADGSLRVEERLHIGARFRLTNHGWFYSFDELNEQGWAWLTEQGAWPAPLVWRELPPPAPEDEEQ
jgi:hypothetical protein